MLLRRSEHVPRKRRKWERTGRYFQRKCSGRSHIDRLSWAMHGPYVTDTKDKQGASAVELP
jgi:hypothetical protein